MQSGSVQDALLCLSCGVLITLGLKQGWGTAEGPVRGCTEGQVRSCALFKFVRALVNLKRHTCLLLKSWVFNDVGPVLASLRTVPYSIKLLSEPDAFRMEPLAEPTNWVLTSEHHA